MFEDDDRMEIPIIAFNIDGSNMTDITFAVIDGNSITSF